MRSNNPGNIENFDEIRLDVADEKTPLVNPSNQQTPSSNVSTLFSRNKINLTPLMQVNNILSVSNKISTVGALLFLKGVIGQDLVEIVSGGVIYGMGLAVNIYLGCAKAELNLNIQFKPELPRPR